MDGCNGHANPASDLADRTVSNDESRVRETARAHGSRNHRSRSLGASIRSWSGCLFARHDSSALGQLHTARLGMAGLDRPLATDSAGETRATHTLHVPHAVCVRSGLVAGDSPVDASGRPGDVHRVGSAVDLCGDVLSRLHSNFARSGASIRPADADHRAGCLDGTGISASHFDDRLRLVLRRSHSVRLAGDDSGK
jgi:hypothetical protein